MSGNSTHGGNHGRFVKGRIGKKVDVLALPMIEVTGGKGSAAGQVKLFSKVRLTADFVKKALLDSGKMVR